MEIQEKGKQGQTAFSTGGSGLIIKELQGREVKVKDNRRVNEGGEKAFRLSKGEGLGNRPVIT